MDMYLMDRLRPIGFTPAIAQALSVLEEAQGSPMRILEVHRDAFHVSDGNRERSAKASPALQRSLVDAGEALTVGDWVLVDEDQHGTCWLKHRMPPLTQIVRRNSSGQRQTLVSNVDTAMLIMGLDNDFNLRRLEQYIALVKPAGIWPIVVLPSGTCAKTSMREPTSCAIACRTRFPPTRSMHVRLLT